MLTAPTADTPDFGRISSATRSNIRFVVTQLAICDLPYGARFTQVFLNWFHSMQWLGA